MLLVARELRESVFGRRTKFPVQVQEQQREQRVLRPGSTIAPAAFPAMAHQLAHKCWGLIFAFFLAALPCLSPFPLRAFDLRVLLFASRESSVCARTKAQGRVTEMPAHNRREKGESGKGFAGDGGVVLAFGGYGRVLDL